MSLNYGVNPSSYDLIILESKNIKRFLENTKMLVYEKVVTNNVYFSCQETGWMETNLQ